MKRSESISQPKNMHIVRIAPVCNGKIYVIPHPSTNEKNNRMDIPIEEYASQEPSKSGKTAQKIKGKYQLHIRSEIQPRFSVKYHSVSEQKGTVYLYILPLKEESEISFQGGKFITADEIRNNSERFGLNLQQECELLDMAAELWKDFYL